MRVSSRSMRAIVEAVSVALLGAPDSLPAAEHAEPQPQEEPHNSIIDPVELASHFKTLVEEKLGWMAQGQEALPPAVLAFDEAAEALSEGRSGAAEAPQPSAPASEVAAEEPQSPALALEGSEVVQELPMAASVSPAVQLLAAPAAANAEGLLEEFAEAEEEKMEIVEEEVAEPQQPQVLFSEEGEGAFKDFFLFIKDYGWSLRYRVHQLTDSILDLEKPLQLEWVKLRRPVREPDELLSTSGDELFDWEVKEPPNHSGFMYHVTRAVGSGVEAVINFFEGYGLKLLIQPDSGIQLTGGPESSRQSGEGADDEPRSVTHCWVQVMGMPFLPIVQSLAFFNLEERVMDWSA